MIQLNEKQKEAITRCDGPLRIVAGPGTGKTTTLMNKAVYLAEKGLALPNQILFLTFSRKSALDLCKKSQEYREKWGLNSEFEIRTFNSFAVRLLKEGNYKGNRLEYEFDSFIKKGRERGNRNNGIYATQTDYVLDLINNDQQFKESVDNIKECLNWGNIQWRLLAYRVVEMINYIHESGITNERIIESELDDTLKLSLVTVLDIYRLSLNCDRKTEYSLSQFLALKMLKSDPALAKKVTDKFKYILIDEFQDVNDVQYELIKLLMVFNKNVTVVGDIDQSIYGFRGAIPSHFLDFCGEDRTVVLDQNYRSGQSIVGVFREWISETARKNRFNRFEFDMQVVNKTVGCVYKIKSESGKGLAELIEKYVKEKRLDGQLHKIAVLAHTVSINRRNGDFLSDLQTKLNEDGYKTYSPRTGNYFNRGEIKEITSFLEQILNEGNNSYSSIIDAISHLQNSDEFKEKLRTWAEERDLDSVMANIETYKDEVARSNNASGAYDFLRSLDYFLNSYLPLWKSETQDEYEDIESPTLDNHISIMTIHQSKGLEFDTVFFVLNNTVRGPGHTLTIGDLGSTRESKKAEYAREQYVALSRAKNSLFLVKKEELTGDITHLWNHPSANFYS